MTKQCVVLFPGQGSQKIGMLSELEAEYPLIQEVWNEASSALGYDLRAVIQDPQKLNQTQYTQPAILAASVALFRIWAPMTDLEIVGMAGHSLGEYSALVCADAMTLAQGVKLVARRGELMQAAVPEGIGAMLAVLGLEDEQIAGVCHGISTPTQSLTPANFNAPGQVVVAGHQALVPAFIEAATRAGARKVLPLSMSVPSHCALMKPAQDRFGEALSQVPFKMPHYAILQNAALEVPKNLNTLVSNLTRQLCEPVPWVKMMSRFITDGVEDFIECGPGQVLSGLMKRIDRSAQITPVEKLLMQEVEN